MPMPSASPNVSCIDRHPRCVALLSPGLAELFRPSLALGADAVLVGRPYLHALATAGAPGVAHVLHLLRVELEMTMALCGCRTLDDIDRSSLLV